MWKRKEPQPEPQPKSSAPSAPSAPPLPTFLTKPDPLATAALPTAVPPGLEPGFLSKTPALRSSLEAESNISGKLCFTVPTRMDGTLRGEVRATDFLVIGETALVEGCVRADRLLVLGRIRGEILGAERVEIGPSGSVEGLVETRALIVQDGGHLDGDCRIAPSPRATVHQLYRERAAEGGKD